MRDKITIIILAFALICSDAAELLDKGFKILPVIGITAMAVLIALQMFAIGRES